MGHDHTHSHEHSHAHGYTIGRFALVVLLNIIITITQYIGGIVSGSLALISDAGHNLSDVISLILGYIGQKISRKKPGKHYSFGLKRFEVLVALINALTLLLIGGYIIMEAVSRYIQTQPINPGIMLPIACIGLAGNGISMLVLYKSRNLNLNLKAAFLHLMYDAVSSVGVILTGIVLLFYSHLVILDLIVSVAIACMIVASSLDIIKNSLRIFLQGLPPGIHFDDVYKALVGMPGIASIHGLHIWSVDSNEVFLSCHLCMDNDSTVHSDIMIQRVNEMLDKNFGITHTALQIEHTNLCSLNGSCCR